MRRCQFCRRSLKGEPSNVKNCSAKCSLAIEKRRARLKARKRATIAAMLDRAGIRSPQQLRRFISLAKRAGVAL